MKTIHVPFLESMQHCDTSASGHTKHTQSYGPGCVTITMPAAAHLFPFQHWTIMHYPACLCTLNWRKYYYFSWGSWIWGLFPLPMLLLLCAALYLNSWCHSYPVSPPTAASPPPFSTQVRQQHGPFYYSWTLTCGQPRSFTFRWQQDDLTCYCRPQCHPTVPSMATGFLFKNLIIFITLVACICSKCVFETIKLVNSMSFGLCWEKQPENKYLQYRSSTFYEAGKSI